ncbi:MAG: acyltransferase family protein [Pseudomonadota bacterium]
MPKITILKKTNLQEDNWHSVLISLFRGLAALVVAWAHLRAATFPAFGDVTNPSLLFQGLAFSSGFAYLAVMVFFVLSGWLVGGSFLNKMNLDRALQHYTVDRLSRLWLVLVPTFLVALLAGAVIGAIDPARVSFSADDPYSVTAFIGNMFGLQTILVPSFGGNFPLWSLANETWYYILFPLLVLVLRGRSIAWRIGALLAIGAIIQLITPAIVLYFSIWLIGTAFSRVKIEMGPVLRWALLIIIVGTAVLIRLKGKNEISTESYPQFLVFSLLFALFLSSTQFKRLPSPMLDRLDRTGRFFSSFSFTLYVLHVPLIFVMVYLMPSLLGTSQLSPHILSHYLIFVGMFLVLVVGGYYVHLPFEANTWRVRRWVRWHLFTRVDTVRT